METIGRGELDAYRAGDMPDCNRIALLVYQRQLKKASHIKVKAYPIQKIQRKQCHLQHNPVTSADRSLVTPRAVLELYPLTVGFWFQEK